jgi:hypothetical protein
MRLVRYYDTDIDYDTIIQLIQHKIKLRINPLKCYRIFNTRITSAFGDNLRQLSKVCQRFDKNCSCHPQSEAEIIHKTWYKRTDAGVWTVWTSVRQTWCVVLRILKERIKQHKLCFEHTVVSCKRLTMHWPILRWEVQPQKLFMFLTCVVE